MTVITIIAILATLLMTSLSSAQRKAREAVCRSNLHQIGIALNLYLDDFVKRPPDLVTLATTKYVTAKILACPADKTDLSSPSNRFSDGQLAPSPQTEYVVPGVRVSYQDPLSWTDEEWNKLMQAGTRAGVVACVFHDVRAPKDAALGAAPVDGLILRGLLDGTVVRRQVFPSVTEPEETMTDRVSNEPPNAFASGGDPGTAIPTLPPWDFFSDDPPR